MGSHDYLTLMEAAFKSMVSRMAWIQRPASRSFENLDNFRRFWPMMGYHDYLTLMEAKEKFLSDNEAAYELSGDNAIHVRHGPVLDEIMAVMEEFRLSPRNCTIIRF